MSLRTLERTFLCTLISFLLVPPVKAGGPSARTGARAAYQESTQTAILYGGVTATDAGTARSYTLDETWEWDGSRWIRRYPATNPGGRYQHTMVYDPAREQILLFGGRRDTTDLADTWVWRDRNWHPLNIQGPAKRVSAAAAFDPRLNKVILFGGQRLSDDEKSIVYHYDTWEFDGANWNLIAADGPQIRKPVLVYDEARSQLMLLGHVVNGENLDTKMYLFDPATRQWSEVNPSTKPCVNESAALYQRTDQRVVIIGGICTVQTPSTEEMYRWDGENWHKVEGSSAAIRIIDPAAFYDTARDVTIYFGGTTAFTTTPTAVTQAFSYGDWSYPVDRSSPGPRSLFAMKADPARGVIWLLGGINDTESFTDFWKLQDGYWQRVEAEGTPTCVSPVAAFDSQRAKLVVVCPDSNVHEWDGETWRSFTDLRTKPTARRFSSLAYDENIRKTVLFGGYEDTGVYQNKTWTWDGVNWSEVKKDRAPSRALTAMWFDPVLRRTVIFGGIGRKTADGRLERFNDMWSFDGNGWKEIKPATRPAARYGAQVAVNPATNRTILFGGLRLDVEPEGKLKQVYANDTWEWDGTNWRQLDPQPAGPARENGALEYDPATGHLVLFGGWSGYFHSDTWVYRGNEWIVLAE